MRAIIVLLILVGGALCGCHYSQKKTQAVAPVQSVTYPKPPTPQKLLPAQRTLSAIGTLSSEATLNDVLRITGEPWVDTGGGIHDYFTALDDHSSIRVRAHLDGRLISIQHQNIELWHGR